MKGLTEKQKKLPMGLQKAILAKQEKDAKKKPAAKMVTGKMPVKKRY
tara:strand:- start:29 stop:169 length:141 start_codon:yes stop_codon:yes gene_type:complete